MTGRDGEHFREALELLDAAEVETFSAERTCVGKPKGSECWMELTSHPGCYVWNNSLNENVTVSWSGECVDGLGEGVGTLTASVGVDDIIEGTGALQEGRKRGEWVHRTPGWGEGKEFYVNGKLHGESIFRWENGREDEGRYVEGEKHGYWTVRNEDGEIVEEGHWLNGKRDGLWIIRVLNGSVHEGRYVEEKRHGHWIQRTKDGTVSEGSYVNGLKQGKWTYRRADGNVTGWDHYVEGEETGLSFKRSYSIAEEGPKVKGKKHGQWIVRMDGDGVFEEDYDAGKLQTKYGRYEICGGNDHPLQVVNHGGRYLGGEKHGLWTELNRISVYVAQG